MSKQWFIDYAESKGGKALTDAQKELVSKETSYAGVRALLVEFKKSKASSSKKKSDKPITKVIDEVVSNEE